MKKIISLLYFIYFNKKVRNLDYFNFHKLITYNPNYEQDFPLKNNMLYGNFKAAITLEKQSKLSFDYYIEHGIIFSKQIGAAAYIPPRIKKIYTFSNQRAKLLQTYYPNKEIVAIGAYILNIPFFKKKSILDKLKQKNGKTLIVFPVHSLPMVNAQFDQENFTNEIIKVSQNFNKTYICLHYVDILNGKSKLYENLGFEVLCAGHKLDTRFINRLKDIIYLSDHTMSNSIGTHLGYSIVMNRPHYFYYQQIKTTTINNKFQENYENVENKEKERLSIQAKKLFTLNHIITEEHIKFIKEYWGNF